MGKRTPEELRALSVEVREKIVSIREARDKQSIELEKLERYARFWEHGIDPRDVASRAEFGPDDTEVLVTFKDGTQSKVSVSLFSFSFLPR